MKIYIWSIILLTIIMFLGCEDSPTENITQITNITYISDSLTNPNVFPKVIFTNPSDGAIGPFGVTDLTVLSSTYPKVTVQFNKMMFLDTFHKGGITLSSEDTYYDLHLINDYTDLFHNIVIFYPYHNYLAGKTYKLKVDTTLYDLHGYNLDEPYEVSFIPEPNFRVRSYYPNSDYAGPHFSGFYISFNSILDTSIFSKINITPYIDGIWELSRDFFNQDSALAVYRTTDPRSYNTTYKVVVSENAKDRNGLILGEEFNYSFTTASFNVQLSSYSSGIGSGGFDRQNSIYFVFNAPIEEETASSSISVTPQIDYDLIFSEHGDNSSVRINFDESQFQPNTQYTITFQSTIKSTFGDSLEEFNYSFTTGSL